MLFDLDGVITPTAQLHRKAWNRMFTAFLNQQGATPYTEQDYFDYLDGRRRDEGVAALLASRGIQLEPQEIQNLGLRKNEDFLRLVEEEGVQPYPGSVALLNALDKATPAPRSAIVSSSKNARPVLNAAGLLERFELIVDGVVAGENHLPGKPAPDTYLYAAQQLGIPAAEAVVVEDATSGVASGRAGGFGLVIGVDRGAGADALRQAGADIVVADLAELIPGEGTR